MILIEQEPIERVGVSLYLSKMFTRYYARNFKFGHHFNVAVHNSPTLDAACAAARAFFDRAPAINPEPSLMGL